MDYEYSGECAFTDLPEWAQRRFDVSAPDKRIQLPGDVTAYLINACPHCSTPYSQTRVAYSFYVSSYARNNRHRVDRMNPGIDADLFRPCYDILDYEDGLTFWRSLDEGKERVQEIAQAENLKEKGGAS